MTKPMAWPKEPEIEAGPPIFPAVLHRCEKKLAYERAMKEAYAQRLRIAVEALKAYDRNMPIAKLAAHTLAEIGPLPDEAG